ncbi:MAG TPA: plastocyanin/azurin family copper-binding protein, partial [Bacteroidota bacterium]|nr:plastocyanin/azurin family copper-binding protein [Bacteroidota bacterium]
MKTPDTSRHRRIELILVFIIFFVPGAKVSAATYTIQFGGSLGYIYSPNSLNVSVGDTIQWVGDFSMHSLSSTSVPSGAASFHQTSGSTFSYRITVAGAYLYQCDYHYSLGMVGSFTATTPTDVVQAKPSANPSAFQLKQNFPNPFNPTTIISFDLPEISIVSLKIYNITGHEVATLVNGPMASGKHSVSWNAASL